MGQLVPVAIGLSFVGLNSLISSRGRTTTTRNTVEGSKVDANAPRAEYGYGIDVFYGMCKKSSCSLIWAQPLREERIETESVEETTQGGGGGKGGGAQNTQRTITTEVTYNYYLTAAYLIGGTISSIRKVWLDGKLVYSSTSSGTDRSQTFSSHCQIMTGSSDQSISSTIQAYEGNDIPALRYRSYLVFDDYPISEYEGSGFPLVDVQVVGEEATVDVGNEDWCLVGDILRNIMLKAGIPEDRIAIDLNAPNQNQNVPGYQFQSGKTYRSAIEELQQLYFLVVSEVGTTVIFSHQSAVELNDQDIILERYLGTRTENSSETYIQRQLNVEEVFAASSITFLDAGNELKENSISSYNPSYTHNNTVDLKPAITLTPGQATDIADRLLYESEIQNIRLEKLRLMPTWSTLQVGQVFALVKENDNVLSQQFQITKKTRATNFTIEIEAVRFKNAIFVNDTIGGVGDTENPIPIVSYSSVFIPDFSFVTDAERAGNYNAPEETTNYGTAEALPLDLPLLNEAHSPPLFYVAIRPLSNWTTGNLFLSKDNGASYELTRSITSNSLMGTVSNALGDHASSLFDKVNTIQVVMDNNSSTIDPVTESQFLRGDSYLLLGNEIIAFRDVVIVSNDPLTYDISYLKRGHKGTEYYTDKHTTNETLIVLSGYKIRVSSGQNFINRQLFFKAVGAGQSEPVVTNSNSIVTQGNSIKPLPPLPILGERVGLDLIITWYRRTRTYNGLVDYADIGYAGGELRQYQLDIFNGPSVVRTVTLTDTETYTYTEAEQVTDFGAAQNIVDVKIRQLSSYPVALNEAKIVSL